MKGWVNKLTTVEQVTNYTKAGGACGKCKADIQAILDKVNGKPAEAESAKTAPLTPVQKAIKVETVLERDVRPALRRDGGDIELVDVKGDKVIVRFLGHCAGCMAARLTQDGLVEKALRAAIDPNISVEAV